MHCRCVQLWEPDKENLFTKSGESWEILLYQLRSLLLESFGRYLDKFEEKIRSMREKYGNPDWPFVDYFLVHVRLLYSLVFWCFFFPFYLSFKDEKLNFNREKNKLLCKGETKVLLKWNSWNVIFWKMLKINLKIPCINCCLFDNWVIL